MSESEQPRVIAEFVDYTEMLDALRQRVTELQINGEAFDEYSGLPRGYLSKLAGPRPVRRLGMTSFGPVISALGLRCIFVEDEEATKRLKTRVPSAKSGLIRPTRSYFTMTDRKWARIAKLGAAARKKQWQKVPKKVRVEMMRELVRKRWRKADATARLARKARARRLNETTVGPVLFVS